MEKKNGLFEYDEMAMFFRKPYKINDKLSIRQPTIGEIVEMGEARYFNTAHIFTATPTDMMVQLEDMGVSYEDVSDFELFCTLVKNIPYEESKIFFEGIDFTQFEWGTVGEGETERTVFYSKSQGISLDFSIVMRIQDYLRFLHGFKKNELFAATKTTRRLLIEDERMRQEMRKRKKEKSSLMPLISALVNMPGFKYNSRQLEQIGIYEFFDAVSRISAIHSSTALLNGCYSGNIDMSKLNKNDLNLMRDLK
jgi:hypothetical protein